METHSTESASNEPKPTQSSSVDLTHGIGQHLRAMRRTRNLTQRRVGELAGVGASAICDIEHGRNNLTIDMLWRVCQALGLRPHISLRGKESPKPLLSVELAPVESNPGQFSRITPVSTESISGGLIRIELLPTELHESQVVCLGVDASDPSRADMSGVARWPA